MNRERRKVIGIIFADAAKYTLTAGVLGSLLAEKFSALVYIITGFAFILLMCLAYFITPKDKPNG
ncbi:MAG: hypothetical protein FVQ77_00970 [Cytophagales bacterium]|nr:hypothetical protein [Cytophagales bacterium]